MALWVGGTRQIPHGRVWLAARKGTVRCFAALCGMVLIAGGADHLSPVMAQPAKQFHDNGADVRRIAVTRNKSRTITLDRPFTAAVVGAPAVADVLPMSDYVMYVQGKKVGTTNISVFDKNKQLISVIDVSVLLDTATIAKSIRESVGSPDIRVSSSNDQVVLSGTAKDAPDAERAVAIAKSMAPDVPIINAMKVAAAQQVLLKVRYLEVDRKVGREIGVNWYGSNTKGTRGVSTGLGAPTQATTNGISIFEGVGTLASGTTSQPFGTLIANVVSQGINLDVMLTALENKGLVRALAQPDLVALSGDTAKFFAGGEIPVPTVQGIGANATVTTEYKPYGIELAFVPTVLTTGVINLRIAPSVSQLDYANAVENQGFKIPAITKRETSTTVELRDGQSFAVSGLLQSESIRDISQVPWLGTLPVLGTLFRSTSFQQKETELVVIVTPHLVAPAVPGQQLATPLDQRLPGNDRDMFLDGQTDIRQRYNKYVTSGGETKGPYGHIMPLTGN